MKDISNHCTPVATCTGVDFVCCVFYCSGPMLALCLAREDAVSGWRDMLGPTEIPVAKEQQPDWYT